MNRDYFLRELEYLLMDISEEEREAALEYYTDYFDEAGPEHEAELAAKLGSPAKVAAEIKAGLADDTDGGEFTERGYRDERFEEHGQMPDHYTEVVTGEVVDDDAEDSHSGRRRAEHRYRSAEHRYRRENGHGADGQDGQNGRSGRGNGLLLLILFLIFGLPLAGSIIGAGFSIVFGLLGAVFGIFGGLIGLIVGAVAAVVGLFAGGIGTIIAGICNLMTPTYGIMTIGFGFFMLAGAFLLLVVVKWGCSTAVPGLFRFCIELVRKCFGAVRRLVGRIFGRGGETR